MKKLNLLFLAALVLLGVIITSATSSLKKVHAGMINLEQDFHNLDSPTQLSNSSQNLTTVEGVPHGWALDKLVSLENYTSTSYDYQQCTWWVYNRAKEFGINYSTSMGNGADWQNQPMYKVTTSPLLHSAVSFTAGQIVGGQWQADQTYGHVAFVEDIHPDGSILISQSGLGFKSVVNYQVLSASDSKQLHYVIGQ